VVVGEYLLSYQKEDLKWLWMFAWEREREREGKSLEYLL
jgi:hypothetical protein